MRPASPTGESLPRSTPPRAALLWLHHHHKAAPRFSQIASFAHSTFNRTERWAIRIAVNQAAAGRPKLRVEPARSGKRGSPRRRRHVDQAQQAIRRCAILRRQPARFDKIGSRLPRRQAVSFMDDERQTRPGDGAPACARQDSRMPAASAAAGRRAAARSQRACARTHEGASSRPDVEPRVEVRP